MRDGHNAWSDLMQDQLEKGKRIGALKDGAKDHDTECEICEATPTVHPTGLCGPCCFGEVDTINGNW